MNAKDVVVLEVMDDAAWDAFLREMETRLAFWKTVLGDARRVEVGETINVRLKSRFDA